MAIFKGAGVAMVTPMKENEDINFEKIEELVEFHINNGTDAIIVCGTTGEPSTQDVDEHMDAIACAVNAAKKRIPIIAGCGSNNTRTSEYTSTTSQKLGADALLMVTPYYNKCTQKGLYEHFVRLAKGVDLPIILYNVPSRTGVNMLPETAVKLGRDCENIVAIKEASGNISQIGQLAAMLQYEPVLDIYSGNDDQIAPILALGGIGVISVLSNVAPQQTHDIVQAFFDGDFAKCTRMQLEAMDLINALFCEVNPIPVKTAMNLMGMEVGPLRSPLCSMDPKNEERLRKALTDYGIQLVK
ncbi:MAG: 4-hydroxy-tetrahydrodipicolinate synthase [Lachnospiraceae bacterium]|nr:4-hydroxy-tetrahydrodipicolinate synthase [Lachnospiraceae bacterium]